MEPEMKQRIAEHAEVLGECLVQMKEHIPAGLIAEKAKLGPTELQAMATSIFIAMTPKQSYYNGNGGSKPAATEAPPYRPDEGKNGGGNYDGPASENQVDLIARLKGEINKLSKDEGEAIVAGFLEDNGADMVAKLTKSQASSLCTTLIEAKKGLKAGGKK